MPIVYKGRVFSVEVDRHRFPDGREREVAIVRHPPSVVIIPVQDDGRVILIRQYRASVGRELWEVPAGSVDPDESPDAAVARECEEEIGLVPGRVEISSDNRSFRTLADQGAGCAITPVG